MLPAQADRFLRVVPPQRRTEAEEVMEMTNVELLSILLSVAGLIVGQ